MITSLIVAAPFVLIVLCLVGGYLIYRKRRGSSAVPTKDSKASPQ